jgi:hypothetical protein
MKAYKVELLIIDFDQIGGEGIKNMIENLRYLATTVKNIKEVDIGEWTDDHPLNKRITSNEEYKRLFP